MKYYHLTNNKKQDFTTIGTGLWLLEQIRRETII